MAAIQFTKNYTDHSSQNGFQFEFHCDKCGSGHRSSFIASKLGMAANFLKAASSLLGGFSGAARGADHINDALRGKAWDDAFQEAIDEIKPKFHQCRRCGRWTCPAVCWNAKASLCKACAPDLGEEAAAAQADALRLQVASQMHSKAAKADLVGDIDITKQKAGACPHCNAPVSGGKFCPGCGKPLSAPSACAKCKAQIPDGAKFCPECGQPRA